MYLSRVELSPYRRNTLTALQSPQIMHASVMASFDSFANPQESEGRVLWRIDKVGSATYLLIQSPFKPDLHHMVDQYGKPEAGQGWDVVDYEPFLSDISDGQEWRFRLRANPVRSVPSDRIGMRGKVCHHITAEQQLQWLMNRSEKSGFCIVDGDGNPTATVIQRDLRKFRRGNGIVTISTVTFEGILSVTDSSKLINSIHNGIGRAKAYGCGMLTLAKP